MHFLSRRHNTRSDEYGGSLENRVRLLRELIEDTKDAVGATCAVAVRLAVEEFLGPDGITSQVEGKDILSMLAELPDLWDVNVSSWENDSLSSRFSREGFQEEGVAFVKSVTSKPVVGVGRFTSPETMLDQIRRGVLDFIGAARPSIADPFLPRKIEEGRPEDIRECIGCNICVSGDSTMVPIRCTQNPTMAEEWRKGWHPEIVPPARNTASVLVIGAGPAGLECAMQLGRRGYRVSLAESGRDLGGRLIGETRLPGLSQWGRVREYREYQIGKLSNVEIFRSSTLTAQDVIDFGAEHVVVATGSEWRRDGVGRANWRAVPVSGDLPVYSPDDILAGMKLSGRVIVFDDDHYYMGGAIAARLRYEGADVTLATPAADVSHWTHNTLEQGRIQSELMKAGVAIMPHRNLHRIDSGSLQLSCIYTGEEIVRECDSLIVVTARQPRDGLYRELLEREAETSAAGIRTVRRVGDCLAPGTIAAAVYGGHRYAREIEEPERDEVPFLREIPGMAGS
jgi:dimethylamine/trimethylamine dehydrogenase